MYIKKGYVHSKKFILCVITESGDGEEGELCQDQKILFLLR